MLATARNSSLLLVLATVLIQTGCSIRVGGWKIGGPTLQGNGVIATEERSLDEFDAIEISGAANVELTTGTDPGVTVSADENLLEIIETSVANRCLTIRFNESFSSQNPVVIKASTIQLVSYRGSGATRGIIDRLETDSFKVDLSGASSLKVLSGMAGTLTVDASGASTFSAHDLAANTASVEASGASTIVVNASEKLTADASGASSVRYVGTPNLLSKDASGAASIEEKN